MQIELKIVSVKESVPWDGPATTTLLSKHGKLLFDTEQQGVLAMHSTRDAMFIPLSNVRYFIEHGPAAQKQEEAAAVEAAKAAKELAEKQKARKVAEAHEAPQGVEKYAKDPLTGAVELKKV